MVFNTVLIFQRISSLWPSNGRLTHRNIPTLYDTQYNEVHECTIPVQTLRLWLCALIIHAVVMSVHSNCVAENAFMDVPDVGVQVEYVVDSRWWEGN